MSYIKGRFPGNAGVLVRVCVVLGALVLLNPVTRGAEEDAALTQQMQLQMEAILHAAGQPAAEGVNLSLDKSIDFAAITRGVLGKHRKSLSEEQIASFQTEFKKSMTSLLRAAVKGAGEYKVTVTRTEKKRPDRAQAFAEVVTESQQKIELAASIALKDGDWKVRNLIFEGINLGLSYRSQFDELMKANDGDPEKAIIAWAQRVAEAQALAN